MRRRTDEEFTATMGSERERVGVDAEPPFDFWAYVEATPPADFSGHDFSEGRVSYAYNMRGSTYQHVLVECEKPHVFLGRRAPSFGPEPALRIYVN